MPSQESREPAGDAPLEPRERTADPPLPQAWVPRVVNAALAVFFVAVLAPIATNLDGKAGYVQFALIAFATPFAILSVLCLASAARPGSLGRAARRARTRRRS